MHCAEELAPGAGGSVGTSPPRSIISVARELPLREPKIKYEWACSLAAPGGPLGPRGREKIDEGYRWFRMGPRSD